MMTVEMWVGSFFRLIDNLFLLIIDNNDILVQSWGYHVVVFIGIFLPQSGLHSLFTHMFFFSFESFTMVYGIILKPRIKITILE